MKKYALLMFAGALMSFIACTNDEFPLEQETESNKTTEGVIFTAQKFLSAESTESRTSITPDEDGATFAWVAGDSIAIVPDEGAQIYFVIDEIDVQNADKAVFTGGAWGLKTDNEYAAYYPFIPDYSINQTNVPVDYSVQAYKPGANGTVTPSHDYMVARSVKQDGGNLKFDFTHLGALVEVKFSIPEDGTIKRLDLMTNETILPLKGTFDLTAENVTIASNSADLSNKMVVNVEGVEAQAEETVSVFFMMPPMDTETFNTNMLTAVVTYGDNNDVLSFRINSDYAGLKASTYYTLGTEKMVFRPAKKDLHDMVDKATYDNYKEKVRFVTGSTHLSGDKIYDGDCAAYAVVNGDWVEIHFTANTVYLPENSSALFQSLTLDIKEIDMSAFLSDEVTDMSFMFEGCRDLTKVTMNANTQNVTTMKAMFKGCSQLNTLDLAGFNTEKVTDMSAMFENCTSLTSIALGSNFKTEKVTDMSKMFRGCSELNTLDLSVFNTGAVTNMSAMFDNCTSLTSITLGSNFNTEKVTDMSAMFKGCSKLNLGLTGFNTGNVTNMSSMFEGCTSLPATWLTFGSNFKTEKVTDMSAMFKNCSQFKLLNLDRFNFEEVVNMSSMFEGCSSLVDLAINKLDLAGYDGEELDLSKMFKGCSALLSLDLSGLWGLKCKDMSYMFYGCSNLNRLNMSNCYFGYFNRDNYNNVNMNFDSMFEGLGSNLTQKADILVSEKFGDYSIKNYLENNKAAFKMNEAKAQISYQ